LLNKSLPSSTSSSTNATFSYNSNVEVPLYFTVSNNKSANLLAREYNFERLKGNVNILANQLQDKSFNSPINLSVLNTTSKAASDSINESINETLSLANQSR